MSSRVVLSGIVQSFGTRLGEGKGCLGIALMITLNDAFRYNVTRCVSFSVDRQFDTSSLYVTSK